MPAIAKILITFVFILLFLIASAVGFSAQIVRYFAHDW
jgi:hypothetical protein